MASNLHELPDLVRLAAEIGIEEVKVVYLTVFDDALRADSLWDRQSEVRDVFAQAETRSGNDLALCSSCRTSRVRTKRATARTRTSLSPGAISS